MSGNNNERFTQVVENVVEQLKNDEEPSVEKAIIGTDWNTASFVKKSKDFQKVLFEVTPYELIAKRQKQQLGSYELKKLIWPRNFTPLKASEVCEKEGFEIVFTGYDRHQSLYSMIKFPDWEHRDRALDKLYKLAGLYAAEKVEHTVSTPLEEMSDEELDKYIAQHGASRAVKHGKTDTTLDKAQQQAVDGEVKA